MRHGAFIPDLGLVGRATLDQEPIGYAFFGTYRDGVDGEHYLTASGVLAEYRSSSEMLRRLLLSSMYELHGALWERLRRSLPNRISS